MTKKKKKPARRSTRRPVRVTRSAIAAHGAGAPPIPKLLPMLAPVRVTPDWANRVQDEIAQAIGPATLPHVIDPELVVLDECRKKLEAQLGREARVRVARYLLARFVDLPGGGL